MSFSDQHTSVVNRLHKVLAHGPPQALVGGDGCAVGVSGCAMIEAMIAGEADPAKLASYAKGRLKAKHEELVESPEGCLSEHHRWMLGELWEQLGQLEQDILHLRRPTEAQDVGV